MKEEGHPEFSNQNLSPRRMFENCRAMIQANVGPMIAPGNLCSDIPPDHRSISSGCLEIYEFINFEFISLIS